MNYTRICFMMLFCFHVSQPYDDDDDDDRYTILMSYIHMNTELYVLKHENDENDELSEIQ
jgi:hypothetical protein